MCRATQHVLGKSGFNYAWPFSEIPLLSVLFGKLPRRALPERSWRRKAREGLNSVFEFGFQILSYDETRVPVFSTYQSIMSHKNVLHVQRRGALVRSSHAGHAALPVR